MIFIFPSYLCFTYIALSPKYELIHIFSAGFKHKQTNVFPQLLLLYRSIRAAPGKQSYHFSRQNTLENSNISKPIELSQNPLQVNSCSSIFKHIKVYRGFLCICALFIEVKLPNMCILEVHMCFKAHYRGFLCICAF